MSPSGLLGTTLDGEVVLLDLERARLFHFDSWTLRVWEACDGRSAGELTSALGAPLERVTETLLTLADAGVIHSGGAGWVRTPVRWV